jgi:hypothetical protein
MRRDAAQQRPCCSSSPTCSCPLPISRIVRRL